MLEAWLRERHGLPEDPVFTRIRGGRLSRDAIECLITKHTHLAAQTCHSLKQKRVSPHVLRHAIAMDLLQDGVDRTVRALAGARIRGDNADVSSFGHAFEGEALSHTEPLGTKLERYRPE